VLPLSAAPFVPAAHPAPPRTPSGVRKFPHLCPYSRHYPLGRPPTYTIYRIEPLQGQLKRAHHLLDPLVVDCDLIIQKLDLLEHPLEQPLMMLAHTTFQTLDQFIVF